MAFKLKDAEIIRTTIAKKDTNAIAAGSLVTLSSGLVATAVAASTALAWTPGGATASATTIEVSLFNDFTLVGTADQNAAQTDAGTTVDITDAQLINLGTSSTNVVRVGISQDSFTVGSTDNVEIRIIKYLF
jgi:hypothetical protein